MLDVYYSGRLNISDIKSKNSISYQRTVHLSAMTAAGVNESHRTQNVKFAIGGFEYDDLTSPINDQDSS